jgi:ribokinase
LELEMAKSGVCILGIYVCDVAFTAMRQPILGETLIGSRFAMGPGGKGSNQTIAAARAGADVTFITNLGQDLFGDNAMSMYAKDNVTPRVRRISDVATGAAYIFLEEGTGANAIIVVPGAADTITAADVKGNADAITNAAVFMTQLEAPIAQCAQALAMAKAAGTTTILNPAPAAEIDMAVYKHCDYLTPNESEAATLTGIAVKDIETARQAADVFLKRGVDTALITLGGQGSLLHSKDKSIHIPIFNAGKVVDTTGAGDAFNGGFAAALARGASPEDAARFGSATAGISVTRPGTAPSMPKRSEIEALLRG